MLWKFWDSQIPGRAPTFMWWCAHKNTFILSRAWSISIRGSWKNRNKQVDGIFVSFNVEDTKDFYFNLNKDGLWLWPWPVKGVGQPLRAFQSFSLSLESIDLTGRTLMLSARSSDVRMGGADLMWVPSLGGRRQRWCRRLKVSSDLDDASAQRGGEGRSCCRSCPEVVVNRGLGCPCPGNEGGRSWWRSCLKMVEVDLGGRSCLESRLCKSRRIL